MRYILIVAVVFILFSALIITMMIIPKKQWYKFAEPFFAALVKNGYSVDRKRKLIFADDTTVRVWPRAMNGGNFNGYFYERRIGRKCVSVYIYSPCSEYNRNELEKVIIILKNTQF